MTNKNKKDNPKSTKKSEKFYIINNVFKFSSKPDVHYNVASHLIGTGGEGLGAGNFTWPEYKSERERIRWNTQKYSDHTIVEAFEEEYNTPIETKRMDIEMVPSELKVGDVINVNILNVSKRSVTFDTRNIKDNVYSAVDLSKYERFKNPTSSYMPINDIEARVVNVSKMGTKIDVIEPMVDGYVMRNVNKPWIQKELGNPHTVRVMNLQLTRGGFLGKVALPNVSNFLGEPYLVDAFIPGSQIVLNITDNFEQFIGKDVDAFIVNYIQKPGSKQMSLVCSVKEYLKFKGESLMIDMFKNWCEDNAAWKTTSEFNNIGVVTGIINSSKKCGVFVELPNLYITGMVSVSPAELVNYKPGDKVNVKISGFEEETYYNPVIQQSQHIEPYKITNGCIEKCTLKPILILA